MTFTFQTALPAEAVFAAKRFSKMQVFFKPVPSSVSDSPGAFAV
ncbi:hypothetical protein [Neisseria animaloris]|nr:hypothetical protein [Neisseria animaloris]